jgi:Na+-driven multidrug efflux pump
MRAPIVALCYPFARPILFGLFMTIAATLFSHDIISLFVTARHDVDDLLSTNTLLCVQFSR